MSKIECGIDRNLDSEILLIDGDEFYPSEGEDAFEVLASKLKGDMLSDIPEGVSIKLCDRVINSGELTPRQPFCTFVHEKGGRFISHVDTVFIFDEEKIPDYETRLERLNAAVEHAISVLKPLSDDNKLLHMEHSVDDEIAYFKFDLIIPNQNFLDAEKYVNAIEQNLHMDFEQRLIFICHASEDKEFVGKLVTELDRRALHAWYDKREILVGDSIVARINAALGKARYLIAILSPRSIKKPWVQRELDSTLMRQLKQANIRILPVLLENCDIPPLLQGIRYANFTESFTQGLQELLAAIR